MTPHRVQSVLTGVIAASVTIFLTAAVLFLLLRRLGDEIGTTWAAVIAIGAAGCLLVSLSVGYLTGAAPQNQS